MIWKRDEQPDGGGAAMAAGGEARAMAEGAAAKGGGEVTVIGPGARIEGTVVSSGSLRVDGRVKGTITAEGDVMLSPTAVVEADIHADNVAIAGSFKGDLSVKGTAELARGGRVEGNITSATLVIQEGALFTGQSVMSEPSGSRSTEAQRSGGPGDADPGSPRPAETPRPAGTRPAGATRPAGTPEPS